MMFDPVRADFEERLARLDMMSRRGLGLEAPGTLGRSHYRKRGLRLPVITPLVTLVFGLYGLKALLFHGVGMPTYGTRIIELRQGNLIEQIVALLLQPDPLTRALSHIFAAFGF
jgi:hypothetical protein